MTCCPSPTNHELGDIEQVASNRVISYSCFARFFNPFRSFVASTRACFETFSRPGGFEASRVEHSRRQEASSRGFSSVLEASRCRSEPGSKHSSSFFEPRRLRSEPCRACSTSACFAESFGERPGSLEASKVSVSSRRELHFTKQAVSSMFDVRMLRRELRAACPKPRGIESQRFVETRAAFLEARPLEPDSGNQRDSAAN